jgi:transcriptional regulator with XRE-family HTH domain
VVAKTLRSRAKLLCITQDTIGQSAGVSRRTMGHVFRGDRDFKVSTLMSVADALGLELILVPRGAAQTASDVEGFETPAYAIKMRSQRVLERANTQAKQK